MVLAILCFRVVDTIVKLFITLALLASQPVDQFARIPVGRSGRLNWWLGEIVSLVPDKTIDIKPADALADWPTG